MQSFNDKGEGIPDFSSMTIRQLSDFISQRNQNTWGKRRDPSVDDLTNEAIKYLREKMENPDHIDDIENMIYENECKLSRLFIQLKNKYKSIHVDVLRNRLKELENNYKIEGLSIFQKQALAELITLVEECMAYNKSTDLAKGSDLYQLEIQFLEYKGMTISFFNSLTSIYEKMSEEDLLNHIKELRESLLKNVGLILEFEAANELLLFVGEIYRILHKKEIDFDIKIPLY